jgi:hypothetical protein
VFPRLGADVFGCPMADWRDESVSRENRRCCHREPNIPAGIRVTPGVLVGQGCSFANG